MRTRLRFHTLAPPIGTLFVFVIVVAISMALLAIRFSQLQKQIAATTTASRSLIELSSIRSLTKENLLRYRIAEKSKFREELDSLEKNRVQETGRLRREVLNIESDARELSVFFAGSDETASIRKSILDAVETGDLKKADRLKSSYEILYMVDTARLKDLHAFLQKRLNSSEKNLNQLLQMVAALVFAMVLLGAGLAFWMSRFYNERVLYPLSLLHRGLRSVAEGKLGQQMPVTVAPREIHEMLQDFNHMTNRLEQATNESTEAREQALRHARIKSDFLSNMSHEIRTPLNVIVGVSDELTRRNLDPQTKKEIQTLHKSGRMLMNIIGDILDFSRLESGKVILARENFKLHELLKRVTDVLEPLAKAKQLHLSLFVDPSVPEEICGDLQRLERAIMNLVSNAIKFTKIGFVRVECRMEGYNSLGEPLLEIRVSDSGIGIPREKMGDLFSRFVQADSSVTRHYGGTGLGLAIVKQIAVLMRGDIRVESKRGVGSLFVLTIPFEKSDGAVAREPFNNVVSIPFENSLEGVRILCVDDSPDNLFLIKMYLEGTGAHLEQASNGREAIAAAIAKKFDVILMDVQMPELDGHQATREIRRIESETGRPHAIIVALTAFALQHEVVLSAESGCDYHLTKPILKPKLLETIRGLIAQKRMPAAHEHQSVL